jgi:DNA-binding transcriptional LysR family regulator
MDLNEIAIFIKVAQLGSFSAAAKQLNMPNSTVSAKVSGLEKRLGVTLIQRTTRKLSLTDQGKAYFDRCVVGIDALRAADEEVVSIQGEPHGLLRITAPTELGSMILPAVISAFKKKHPKMNLEILFSDRLVDLISEGVDLAVRAGELKDSSLKAKRLGAVYFAPFASPHYLKAQKNLQVPKDLAQACCLQFPPMGLDSWKLTNGKSTVHVPMSKQLVINDLLAIRAMALLGMGVAMLPTFMVLNEVKNNKLVRILPDWRTELQPVHFVYGGQKFTSPKVTAFMDVATDLIKESLRDCEL